ncbi:unnamed protein product, partial [Coregonus sp. 'balchen']
GLGAIALDLEGDPCPSAFSRIRDTASLKKGGSLRTSRHSSDLFSETGEKSGQVEKSKKNARQRQNDFKKMIEEVTHRLVKLVRGALLPSTLTELELRLIIFEALVALEIPNDLLQVIQDLLLELRHHCLVVTLHHTTEDVKRVAEKEDWVIDNEGITSLPAQFEQCMVQMLQSLKEPMDTKPGEVNILQLDQDQASELCVDIMKVFINCLEQLSTKTDRDIDTSHMSVDLASTKLFSGIQEDFCPTLKHGFTGTEKITRVTVRAVKELDESLFDAYIERKSDPIVGSLEPGIYAGHFDWKDCSTPT